MRAVAVPMADPQLEFHWTPDPGFLIQGFLIQCPHRRSLRSTIVVMAVVQVVWQSTVVGLRGKEALDKDPRVWKPMELRLWIGRGYRRRPRGIRNPPGSEASWGAFLI